MNSIERQVARVWALAAAAVLTMSLCAVPAASATSAGRPPLPAACFPADMLGASASERAPVKGPRTFDTDIPKLAIAPFAAVPPSLAGRAVRSVRLPRDKKLIALTFDFCEQTGEIAGYDGAIVDTLRAHGVKATLFMGGKWLRSHKERTRQLIADPLFEIANHGWSHKNLRLYSGADLAREVQGPQRAYEAARAELAGAQCMQASPAVAREMPERISLFRFPFGACNAASLAAVNAEGLVPIQWNVSTGDASPSQSAAAITASVVRAAKPGAIVLMHANGRGHNTAAALPKIITMLRQMGYGFATVGELMRLGEPELVPTCYDARPGDTDRYDALFPVVPRRGNVEKRDDGQPATVPR